MAEQKTHWRKLHNPDYLGSYAIPEGKDLIVEIERVETRMITNDKGTQEQTVAILKDLKPWILNSTNQKTITKVLGTPYIEDWQGKKVALFVKMIRAFGEDVEAVRVRDKAPKIELEALTPNSNKWKSAVKLIAEQKHTVDSLRNHYSITEEHANQLNQEANAIA